MNGEETLSEYRVKILSHVIRTYWVVVRNIKGQTPSHNEY